MASPVTLLFHPTFLTSDRDRLAEFFERVFGVPSDRQGALAGNPDYGADPDYAGDYSLYTWIADCWFDAIQPDLYPFAHPALHASLDRLSEIGWIVDDIGALYRAARAAGVRVLDQTGAIIGDEAQLNAGSAVSSDVNLVWLSARDAGLTVELTYMAPAFVSRFAGPFKFWPLVEGGFPDRTGPIGPLGILSTASHRFLTRDLDRAARLMTAVLGGRRIDAGVEPDGGGRHVRFALAGTIVDYVTPGADRGLQAVLDDPPYGLTGERQRDVYHSIVFHVADLARARDHLAAQGIGLEQDQGDMIVTRKEDCLGMCWGFVSIGGRS